MAEGGQEASCESEHTTSYVVTIACAGLLFGTLLRFGETTVLPLVREHLSGLSLPPYTLSVFIAGALTSLVHDIATPASAVEYEASRSGVGGEEHRGRLLGAGPGGTTASAAEVVASQDVEHHSIIEGAIISAQLIDPHIILLVLLPPLIYESASSMNWHVFRRVAGQAWLLAFPGVVVQAFATGAFFRYALGYGPDGGPWDWDVALALGSIVCATDPVAVVATLHSLGAPEKLADVIDGESLLNDGSAMVLFLIFMENIQANAIGAAAHDVGTGTAFFLRLSLGGVALGAVTFYVVITFLLFVENDWRVEVGVLLLGVYGAFAVAELAVSVSGVLAVVTFGLLMARRGKYAFSPSAANVVESVMPMIAHVAETIIFYVAGIAAWEALWAHRDRVVMWHALVLYLFLKAVRAGTVALLFPVLNRMGYHLSAGEGCVVIYAGLRGAVGLALSLMVFQEEAMDSLDRARVHFLVASTAALTMLINGSTTPWLYDWLKLYPANKYRNVIVHKVMHELEGKVMKDIERKLLRGSDWLYSRADWAVVKALLPDFSGVRVLPNNRLRMPDATRPDVFSPAIVHHIARTEPTAAQQSQLPEQAQGTQPGAPAQAASPSCATNSGNGIASAGVIDPALRFPGVRALEEAGVTVRQDYDRRRRKSTGSLAKLRETGAVGSLGLTEIHTDPRRQWRLALAAQEASAALGGGDGAEAKSPVPQSASAAGGGAARRRAARRGILGLFSRGTLPIAPSPAQPRRHDEREGGAAASAGEVTVSGRDPEMAVDGGVGEGVLRPGSGRANATAATRASARATGLDSVPDSVESRMESLAHRHRQAHARGRAVSASEGFVAAVRVSFTWAHQSWSHADKRDGIVETLFASLRTLYEEQYERKQVAGTALAVLNEALSSGEEYLAEHPQATAAAAFDLELDVVLFMLPPHPSWRPLVRRVPAIGPALDRHLDFYRTFARTEALTGFVRAHDELSHVIHGDETRLRVFREAVCPALDRAKAELHAHQRACWKLVALQVNLLTARAAVEMKRDAVAKFAATGALSAADVAQIGPCFDRALYALDTVRYSATAPERYRRAILSAERAVSAEGDGGAYAQPAQPELPLPSAAATFDRPRGAPAILRSATMPQQPPAGTRGVSPARG